VPKVLRELAIEWEVGTALAQPAHDAVRAAPQRKAEQRLANEAVLVRKIDSRIITQSFLNRPQLVQQSAALKRNQPDVRVELVEPSRCLAGCLGGRSTGFAMA
jgi:hypothetical protein